MDIDTSQMDPALQAQVRTFSTMVAAMPTDALAYLVQLLQDELDERRESGR